ncbi:hypothetical protein FA13DRAFT_1669709 [Coprinellus micaceus]|uniref:Nephrocystin 3-like N-terminal domain-containing protein n=1 Tax=Coprinellus micaceus TaxID=71717 RepID=A0A4Y7SPU2_COPMI|nr:hypothetical protein FA13DRAFT_1669709 [Coprinellus micaceus]
MSSHPRTSRDGKRNLLSKVFNRFRITPGSHEASPTLTVTSAPVQQGVDRRPVDRRFATPGGELDTGEHSDSPLPPQTPNIRVEDHSRHHYGDTYTTQYVNGTANTVGTVVNATFGTHSVTTIERAFFSSRNEAALLWDTLPKQRDTVVQQNEYLEESREDVVQDVLGWSDDHTSELSLFIVGAAGVGKSTLARHLTYRLHAVGRLAAFVSLSALPSDARSPESVVKLASREIGGTHPEAIPAILEAIKSCKGASLAEHIEMFLIGPVRSLCLPHSLMVIFDAVDEYEFHATLVKALISLPLSSSSSIKFVLLGRSDPRTRGIGNGSIRPYPLRPVSIPVMERFLTNQFDGVSWEHGRRPAPFHVTKLAELTNGLFIWATVVCSLLKKRLNRLPPDQVLDSILGARRILGDSEKLATLYHQAIVLLFPDSEDQDLFREYLTATLALQAPLPIDEFSNFTGLPIHAIEAIQSDLKALQIRQPEEGSEENSMVYPAGSLFHLSFLEYLESTSTPPAITFHVSMFSSHSQLAGFCFKELPCFLSGSHAPSRLDLNPREQYAVTYLMVHIHRGSPLVQPGATEEWEHSILCATLRQSTIEMLQRWADLVVDLLGGASAIEEYTEGGCDISEDTGEADAVEGSDYHEGCDEKRPESGSEDTELAENSKFVARDADHDATDGGEAPKDDATNHDIWVAQLLHGVATTFGEEYTSRSSFPTSCLEVAVRLRPDEAEFWHDLGWAYYAVSQWSGSVEAHDRAVTAHQNAMRCPDKLTEHDPGRFHYALATALYERFWAFGRSEDLDKSTVLNREALVRRPPGHLKRGFSLNNLANSLSTCVMEKGSCMGEIDEVISLRREALDLLSQGDRYTSIYLRNLAINLRYRYEMAASIVDLEEAIHLGREVLALCPLGHPHHVRVLNRLAGDLTLLYEVLGNRGSLEEAIRLGRVSLSLCPTGHPDRLGSLCILSSTLHLHPDHLDEALQLSRESRSLTPLNHLDRWEVLMTLASILLSRYEQTDSAEELKEATSFCEQASTLCPQNHIRRPKLLTLKAKLSEAASLSSLEF